MNFQGAFLVFDWMRIKNSFTRYFTKYGYELYMFDRPKVVEVVDIFLIKETKRIRIIISAIVFYV